MGLSLLLTSLVVWTAAVALHSVHCSGDNDRVADKLFKHLLKNDNYNSEVRPSDLNEKMRIRVDLFIFSMMEVDEQDQTMVTYSQMVIQWKDEKKLAWDTTDFEIENFTLPQNKLWLPDIMVQNSADPHNQLGYKKLPVEIRNDGYVYWSPNLVTTTMCDIDVTYYPFDTQICDIIISTEISKSADVDLIPGRFSSKQYAADGSWKLLDVGYSKENRTERPQLFFTVRLQRRSTFYVVSIISPVVCLSLTASIVFALPADSGEKMGTGITVLLAFDLYLIIIADFLPDTSLNTSILAVYLTLLLGITTFGVVISAFCLRLHHSVGPVGVKTRALIRFIQRITCTRALRYEFQDEEPRTTATSPDNEGNVENPETECDQQKLEMTWPEVGATVDWLLYILFTTTTFIITVLALTGMVYGGQIRMPSMPPNYVPEEMDDQDNWVETNIDWGKDDPEKVVVTPKPWAPWSWTDPNSTDETTTPFSNAEK